MTHPTPVSESVAHRAASAAAPRRSMSAAAMSAVATFARDTSGLVLGFCVVLTMSALPASADTYTITPEAPGNEVVFLSKAPMESFEGTTRHLSGSIRLDPRALGDSITVEVSVDLATLDTGIGLRNTHMRENHLHTDRYPEAVFRGASLLGDAPAQLEAGVPVTLAISGSFALHGIVRRIEVPVTLIWRPEARVLEATTTFEVFLEDYEIPRPKMLFMKLNEKQIVTVQVRAEAP